MKLVLPNVELVCVENRNIYLAEKAIHETTKNIRFKNVLFFKQLNINSNEEYSYFIMKELNNYITADYCMIIQWDGYVLNSHLWTNDFLKFDYIGAPWDWFKYYKVGNGGFSIRSKKLMNELQNEFYMFTHPEDRLIGCLYRTHLENKGFTFADLETASKFSFETPNSYQKVFTGKDTFGFHDKQSLVWLNKK